MVETCVVLDGDVIGSEDGSTLASLEQTGIGGGIGKETQVPTISHEGSAGRLEGTGKQGEWSISLVTCVMSERRGR